MSESKQPQIQDLLKPPNPVMPGTVENARYQALETKHNELVEQLKKLIADPQVSQKDKRDFIELQVMPVEKEMTELVTTNRKRGGVVDLDGQRIKFTKEMKVKGLAGNTVQLNYFKNTQLKNEGLSPKKVSSTFKSQPVTIEEKETVSVALGPQFKDPITGTAVNPDNVAVDPIAAGEVAPVNSSLAVNAEMPNNRPEQPIADNVASMPAQANAVELNDAGLLNAEAAEQVEGDVKVPETQPQTLTQMGLSLIKPLGHHYTGSGTPVVDHIFNKKKVPVDELDQLSMMHDIEYQLARSIDDIKQADQTMINDIDELLLRGNISTLSFKYMNLVAAKTALTAKDYTGFNTVDFEQNAQYLDNNPKVLEALRGIQSLYNDGINKQRAAKPREPGFDIQSEDNRKEFIQKINQARPVGDIELLQQKKPALEAEFKRGVPSLGPVEKGLEAKMEGAEGEQDEDEKIIASVGGLGDLGEMFEQEAKDITQERKAFINRQRMNINERDYQDFLRNKQIKEQRIQEMDKRERGLPRWLRPEFQKIYDQLDQLAYYSSAEFTEQENQLRYDQDRIRRGQSEQTDMSEQGLNIANNLAEREMKIRYNLPLNKPLWSAPTRGGLSVIPQDNYRVGYSRPYNREGESSFIQNTRNGVGLYNSSFPQPINNLRRNYSMPPMRAQVHQMPRNPIDREQFRHVRMMDRTPRGTATVLNDDFDGLNYKDDRRRDFEGRGMSLGERLQFEMFHMNN